MHKNKPALKMDQRFEDLPLPSMLIKQTSWLHWLLITQLLQAQASEKYIAMTRLEEDHKKTDFKCGKLLEKY